MSRMAIQISYMIKQTDKKNVAQKQDSFGGKDKKNQLILVIKRFPNISFNSMTVGRKNYDLNV